MLKSLKVAKWKDENGGGDVVVGGSLDGDIELFTWGWPPKINFHRSLICRLAIFICNSSLLYWIVYLRLTSKITIKKICFFIQCWYSFLVLAKSLILHEGKLFLSSLCSTESACNA